MKKREHGIDFQISRHEVAAFVMCSSPIGLKFAEQRRKLASPANAVEFRAVKSADSGTRYFTMPRAHMIKGKSHTSSPLFPCIVAAGFTTIHTSCGQLMSRDRASIWSDQFEMRVPASDEVGAIMQSKFLVINQSLCVWISFPLEVCVTAGKGPVLNLFPRTVDSRTQPADYSSDGSARAKLPQPTDRTKSSDLPHTSQFLRPRDRFFGKLRSPDEEY